MRHLYLLSSLLMLAASCKVAKKSAKQSAVYKYPTTSISLDPLDCKNYNEAWPDFVREETRICIKILNVNPFSGSPVAQVASATFDFGAPPDVLQFDKTKAAAEPKTDTPKDLTQKFAARGKKPTKPEKPKGPPKADLQKQIDECARAFVAKYSMLKSTIDLYPKILHILDTPVIKREVLLKMIAEEVNCVLPDMGDCCCYRKVYDEMMLDLKKRYDCVQESYVQLKDQNAQLPKLSISGDLKDKNNKVKLSIKDASLTATQPEPDEYDKKVAALKQLYDRLSSDSVTRIMVQKMDTLTSLCIQLKQSGPFEKCLPLITVTGDSFAISPIILHGKDTSYRFGTVSFKTYGGFRLNFSTGLGFSFLNTNQSYLKEKAGPDSFRIRKTNKTDAVVPSIVAYMHVYWRSKHRITPAITVGASTNPTDFESTKFFLGGSMIFCQDRRFIFSGGITGGQADRLARNFVKNDITYSNADYTGLQDKDLVEKKFRLGLFVGFSYNLSAKR